MKSLNIIFLGRSGSGKGTQLELLKKEFHLVEIDTGALLRSFVKKRGYFYQQVKEIIKKGQLVPFWLVVSLWLNKILPLPLSRGLIFEGSPRQLKEAKILHEVLRWLGREHLVVIYLNVPEKEVMRRLSLRRICARCGKEYSLEFNPHLTHCPACGGKLIRRPDDYPQAIQNRMTYFKKNLIPVIKYFKAQNLLVEVNGLGSVEEVHQRILDNLRQRA